MTDPNAISLPHNWIPRPYQLEVFDALRTGIRRAVLLWHRRCIAEGTLVTLADGSPRAIERLQPGDEILSWSPETGYTTDTVKNVWYAGEKPVVKVQAGGRQELVCTEDHRLMIHSQGRSYRWVKAQDIRPKGKYGSTDSVVLQVGGVAGRLHSGLTVEDAALLGYLVSDGCTVETQSPKFTSTCAALLFRVRELSKQYCAEIKLTPKGNGYDLHFPNGTAGGGATPNEVKEFCRAHGVLCAKKDKRVPKAVWGATNEAIFAFLGAILDSDGSVYHIPEKYAFGGKLIHSKGDVMIHAGLSEALAWDYHYLLRKVGVLSIVKRAKTCWTVRVTASDSVHTLLENALLVHPAKKAVAETIYKTKYTPRLEYNGTHGACVSVVPNGTARTWDIETKAQLHRFFANGYLVHNSGKDDFALHYTACQAMQRPGTYWHMLPNYNQCRKAIWDAINPRTGKRRIDEAFPEVIRETTRSQDMYIRFINGASWQLVGSDSFDSLVGSPPVGLTFSEYALADPRAWAYLRPILADNDGDALFISTPRGKNHFYNMYNNAIDDPSWYVSKVTATDSGLFTPEMLAKEKAELIAEFGEDDGTAIFMQEYFCSFDSAMSGAYFGSHIMDAETQGRVTSVPYDPNVMVSTGWDIGVGDSMAIVFIQRVGLETRIIDYYEATGESIQHAAKVLKEKPYVYEQHVMPHDISVREWGSEAKTRYQTAMELGVKPITLVKRTPKAVDERIHAIRAEFPKMLIDKKRCAVLVEHLKGYKKKWNPILKQWDNKPEHGPESHGIDALGTYLTGVRPIAKPKTVEQIMEKVNYAGAW